MRNMVELADRQEGEDCVYQIRVNGYTEKSREMNIQVQPVEGMNFKKKTHSKRYVSGKKELLSIREVNEDDKKDFIDQGQMLTSKVTEKKTLHRGKEKQRNMDKRTTVANLLAVPIQERRVECYWI
jgi:hypothetical protein